MLSLFLLLIFCLMGCGSTFHSDSLAIEAATQAESEKDYKTALLILNYAEKRANSSADRVAIYQIESEILEALGQDATPVYEKILAIGSPLEASFVALKFASTCEQHFEIIEKYCEEPAAELALQKLKDCAQYSDWLKEIAKKSKRCGDFALYEQAKAASGEERLQILKKLSKRDGPFTDDAFWMLANELSQLGRNQEAYENALEFLKRFGDLGGVFGFGSERSVLYKKVETLAFCLTSGPLKQPKAAQKHERALLKLNSEDRPLERCK